MFSSTYDIYEDIEKLEGDSLQKYGVDVHSLSHQQALQSAQSKRKKALPTLVGIAGMLLSRWYYDDLRKGQVAFCIDEEAAAKVALGLQANKSGLNDLSNLTCWRLQKERHLDHKVKNLSEKNSLSESREDFKPVVLTPENIQSYAPLFLWMADHEYARTMTGSSRKLVDSLTYSLPLDFRSSALTGNGEIPICNEMLADDQSDKPDWFNRIVEAGKPYPASRTETIYYLYHAYLTLTRTAPLRRVSFHMTSVPRNEVEEIRDLMEDPGGFYETWRNDVPQISATGYQAGWPPRQEAVSNDCCWIAYEHDSLPHPCPQGLTLRLLRFSPDINNNDTHTPLHCVDCRDLTALLEAMHLEVNYQDALANDLMTLLESMQGERSQEAAEAIGQGISDLGFQELSSAELLRWLERSQSGRDQGFDYVHSAVLYYAKLSDDFPDAIPHRQAAFENAYRVRMPRVPEDRLQTFLNDLQDKIRVNIKAIFKNESEIELDHQLDEVVQEVQINEMPEESLTENQRKQEVQEEAASIARKRQQLK